MARRVVTEDVTVLGEQLGELHVETLTDTLDAAAQEDYRHALGGSEKAKTRLRAVMAIGATIEDARFHRACVLARAQGTALPVRRDPCFFNPQHLPAVADVAWTPRAGVARDVAVCPDCRERLAHGDAPRARTVQVGDRRVPWWETGGSLPALVAHHAHVVRGTTLRTDTGVAEAMFRAAASQRRQGP